jgi:hypothetical protein
MIDDDIDRSCFGCTLAQYGTIETLREGSTQEGMNPNFRFEPHHAGRCIS